MDFPERASAGIEVVAGVDERVSNAVESSQLAIPVGQTGPVGTSRRASLRQGYIARHMHGSQVEYMVVEDSLIGGKLVVDDKQAVDGVSRGLELNQSMDHVGVEGLLVRLCTPRVVNE